MDNKMKMFLTLGAGLIIIILTVVLFSPGQEKTDLDWIALTSVLISEIALISSFVFMSVHVEKMNSILLKAGFISTSFIYFCITVILAVIREAFTQNVNGFLNIQLILVGITAIIAIALIISGSNKEVNHENDSLLLKNSEMLAFSLRSNHQYRTHEDLLNKLYEEIKYSDKTETVQELDQTINQELISLSAVLKNNPASKDEIEEAIQTILLHLKERNMAALKLKQ